MGEDARPGVRVKVRFAGRDVDGFVLERVAGTDHDGTLTPLRRVVSAEPVLSPQVAALAGELAERYAGTRSDVLRLAVPSRHAATEKKDSVAPAPPSAYDSGAAEAAWAAHAPASAFLAHLADGGSPRAVWSAAPGTDWPTLVAHAVAATTAGGRGALVVVPDGKDVAQVDAALTAVLGADQHVVLTADAGPAKRYRDFLAVARGRRRVVVGTRAAAFAPIAGLGLVVIWDDGDDLHAEPRAPYPHARETLLLRAEREGAAALVGGFAHERRGRAAGPLGLGAPAGGLPRGAAGSGHRLGRGCRRARAGQGPPRAGPTRVPTEVHHAIRDALSTGPVLVQTPRSGYAAALACERCRTPARCRVCTGPLALGSATAPPTCRWCGAADEAWACPECGHRGLRAPVVGETRTAEELGRSFAGTVVRTSGGDRVLASVDDEPAIVVATPGAEPVAAGGYAAVVLLDTWLVLGLAHLRVEEEALRRWANAVGLVRPGGRAVVVGDPAHPAIQALVRWDPAGFAAREAALRREAHLPPASRLATITGEPGAVDDAVTLLDPPVGFELLGPVPFGSDGESRAVLRVPRSHGLDLSRALGEVQRVRSARKLDAVRIQVDPPTL